jgi:hypothetical protein
MRFDPSILAGNYLLCPPPIGRTFGNLVNETLQGCALENKTP